MEVTAGEARENGTDDGDELEDVTEVESTRLEIRRGGRLHTTSKKGFVDLTAGKTAEDGSDDGDELENVPEVEGSGLKVCGGGRVDATGDKGVLELARQEDFMDISAGQATEDGADDGDELQEVAKVEGARLKVSGCWHRWGSGLGLGVPCIVIRTSGICKSGGGSGSNGESDDGGAGVHDDRGPRYVKLGGSLE